MTSTNDSTISDPSMKSRLTAVKGEATEVIYALFQESLLPPALLHRFACDCAARALTREAAAGVPISPILWEALDARRKQIAGQCTEADVTPWVEQARGEAHAASVKRQAYEAATAASDAAADIAYAVRAAAWCVAAAGHAVPAEQESSARLEESQWQVQHLLSLLTSE